MLILTRRTGECFHIRVKNNSNLSPNEMMSVDVRICVISTGTSFCRIGVAAGETVQVLRAELLEH